MSKRVFLYGGAVLWTIALFIVLSDRNVTEQLPMLENHVIRFVVILALNICLGTLIRLGLERRRRARLGAV